MRNSMSRQGKRTLFPTRVASPDQSDLDLGISVPATDGTVLAWGYNGTRQTTIGRWGATPADSRDYGGRGRYALRKTARGGWHISQRTRLSYRRIGRARNVTSRVPDH
jgi:hypothetical protein